MDVLSVLVALLAARLGGVVACALLEHRRQRCSDADIARRIAEGDLPSVSVIVPAYNEEAVIERTVRALARSEWTPTEILVVDDGSIDGTVARVRGMRSEIPSLRLLDQSCNAGKVVALNRGVAEARGDVVVTVDADTLLHRAALGRLVATMQHHGAAAVAGNVRVGNPDRWITRWQALEYVTGLNLDRRAQAWLGCITTVPGAAAAWRRSVLVRLGGFPSGTLAEDTDLSLLLLSRGERIAFQDRAFAYTEAPSTLRGLVRQRSRWLHGNLQCVRKHTLPIVRSAPAIVRFVGLPSLWYAHVGVFLVPLLFFGGLLCRGTLGGLLPWVSVLFVLDLVAVGVAYTLDGAWGRELSGLLAQRIGLPLILEGVFVRVIARSIVGRPMGWNKVERRGLPSDERVHRHS